MKDFQWKEESAKFEEVFNSAEEMRIFLQQNFHVGSILKVNYADGYSYLWLVLSDCNVQVLWDDFSIMRQSDGTYKTYIYDFYDVDEESSYWTFEEIICW